MSDATLQIGIWQSTGTRGDIDANLNEIERAATQARQKGVELLIFPECFLTGYYTDSESVTRTAKDVGESVLERLAAISGTCKLALVIGSYEATDEGIYNSALTFVPGQGLAATYRKQMLYGDWEKQTFVKGTETTIFSYKGFSIGLLICFDIEFPERVRDCAHKGIDLLVTPTSLMEPYHPVAQHFIPTRAYENNIFIAYANRIGREDDFTYIGQSTICAPEGSILARASADRQELLTATLKLSDRKRVLDDFSYLDQLA